MTIRLSLEDARRRYAAGMPRDLDDAIQAAANELAGVEIERAPHAQSCYTDYPTATDIANTIDTIRAHPDMLHISDDGHTITANIPTIPMAYICFTWRLTAIVTTEPGG